MRKSYYTQAELRAADEQSRRESRELEQWHAQWQNNTANCRGRFTSENAFIANCRDLAVTRGMTRTTG